MTPFSKGTVLVIISTIGYGLMPLLSRIAYAEGVSVNTLLFYRFLIASIILWFLYNRSSEKTPVSLRHKGFLALLGFVGYFIPSITLFTAYGRLHSSIATLILFAHPVFVVVFETLLFKTKLNLMKIFSVLLTILGLWVVLAKPDLPIDGLGILLSFIAALTYGIYCLGLYEKHTKATSTLYVTAFVLTTCCFINGLTLLFNHDSMMLPSANALFATVALAILGTLIPAIAFNAGLKLVGPGSATIISTFEPIIVATIGTFILNESFTPRLFVGGVMILIAITFIQSPPTPGQAKEL